MIQYGQVTSQAQTLIRETEAADIRITESGDTRITNDVYFNQIEGTLSANGTKITFFTEQYYKSVGGWIRVIPYAKSSNTWQEPTRIYKKISGTWKRVY